MDDPLSKAQKYTHNHNEQNIEGTEEICAIE